MRYLILLFALFPSTLFAQEGTVEYSVTFDMEMPSMEAIMANLPLDSAMIQQAMQQMSTIPEQFRTIPMRMEFSGHKSFVTPDLPSSPPGMNPLGGGVPLQVAYVDYMEGTMITRMPSFDETAYLISQKIEPLDWSLIDADSTILDYPVKKAEFLSDTINVVV